MDRRFFIRSMLATAGVAATASLLVPRSAQAAGLLGPIGNAADNGAANPVENPADLPAEGVGEAQYWRRRRRWHRRAWRRRYYGRPYWGGPYYRPVRRCWWRRNRWGELVRVCR